jgi:hypothetical protein
MAGRKPPPRTLDPQEEQKIQRFLERAAPLVLQGPNIDEARWRQLSALADELQLTSEQLRRTVQDLCDRGVLKPFEIPGPKPPPLPSAVPGAGDAAVRSMPDSNFALTPPPRHAPKTASRRAEPAAPSPAQQYLDRAGAIIARHRGSGPAAQVELAACAQDLGIDAAQARELLRQLAGNASPAAPLQRVTAPKTIAPAPVAAPPSPPVSARPLPSASPRTATTPSPPASTQPPLSPPSGPPLSSPLSSAAKAGEPTAPPLAAAGAVRADQRRRWRLDENEVAPPPPPLKEPRDTFRDYVRLGFEQSRTLDADRLKELVRHGTTALGLSSVYARHLVAEVAAEQKIAMPDTAGGEARGGQRQEMDPAIAAFIDEAVPILAEHRGVNVKSRVLLNAIARTKNLSDRQVDEALSLLQSRRGSDEEDTERERLVPFGEYLAGFLARLSPPILTSAVEHTLEEQGRMLYGLRADRVRTLIREAARERHLPVISVERAEHHLRELVAELMGESARLPRELRDRIDAEGKQWGLAPDAIESIVSELIGSRVAHQRWERRVTNFALFGASIAVLFVIGFFTWAMLPAHFRGSQPASVVEKPKVAAARPVAVSEEDDSWWDADMSVSVGNARVEMPQLLNVFRELDAKAPERRRAAYDKLAEQFFEGPTDEAQRDVLSRVLSHSYALEPVDENAQRIATALLRPLPRADAKLSEDPKACDRMFRAIKASLASLYQAKGNAARASRLSSAIGQILGVPVDTGRPFRETEHECLAALADKLCRLLISVAGSQPQAASRSYAAVSAQARLYLDRSKLDRLNAEFLVELLTAAVDLWHAYDTLIIDTIQSPDPLAVIKLLRLYERTKSADLQNFMSEPLLKRAGVTPESNGAAAVAAAVRRALGAGAEATVDERWSTLADSAKTVLATSSVSPSLNEQTLAEITRLNYLSTLACALTREESGLATFKEMTDKGMPSLAGEAAKSESGGSASSGGRGGGSLDRIRSLAERLKNRDASNADRVMRLESLAAAVSGLPDIDSRSADLIAEYLLRAKTDAEHARVLDYVGQLTRWKHLRLALADQLEKAKPRREQLQSLLNKVLPRLVTLEAGDAGYDTARIELLRSVLDDLANAAGGVVETFTAYNTASEILTRQYVTQSQLLGITLPDSASADRPGLVLKQLVGQFSPRLRGEMSALQRERLGQLAQRLTAIEYVAANDLQLTVLLQREWGFLLSLMVAERHADRRSQAAAILDELAGSDRQAEHILVQVRDGESALLRLWLLAGEPK